ncbi:cobalamin B12-binding domain-containing protein [Actinophytocola xanthii]|uniref:Cobalamin-binding protein n=1 Tax=Actinophytocola xanthii TaxID=1912961 RepID=A0A1Q8C4E1_9PSEU|nr:cobalamin-dependent protein [Actinophytocola xanthii]OLF09221.1 cobalamin-binding protein [Actinophytocola xanthii]
MSADSLTGVRPVPRYVDLLWDAVVVGDEAGARGVVAGALADGLDRESLLLDVIGAVQRRIGQEWAAGRLRVAQEHAATAINDRVIAALPIHPRPVDGPVGHVTVACVDGEWHALPARLLAEVLLLRGFQVDFLGAHVPGPHLIADLHRTAPDAVALSGSIATRLPTAHATISACQAAGIPVIAGGAAFGYDGRYARLFGAEWAPDARAAADRLARPLPRPRPAHKPIDDLPHLADQEYTMVSRTASRLARTVYKRLESRVPAMRDFSDLQRQHTAEDLRHIVDFLATALYTGDDELFVGFVTWTAGILESRRVPANTLLPTLGLLGDELREFPRAVRMLTRAGEHLSSTISTTGKTE